MGDGPPPEEEDEDSIDVNNPPFPLTAKDRELICMKDADFHRMTWRDLQSILARNELEALLRLPSDLRRYIVWSHRIKQEYGSITNFVVKERLFWTAIPGGSPPQFTHHSPIPFRDARDYAVLLNDWPYGFANGILHLVVWTRTPIAINNADGDVTPVSRQLLKDFIEEYFEKDLENGREKVTWFKNWVSLQSVRGVDHVHVLVRDVPDNVLKKWLIRRDL